MYFCRPFDGVLLLKINYVGMKKVLFLWCWSLAALLGDAQSIEDMSFGEENTLEVMTWNIEHFPKKGYTTLEYVSRVINALDVDVVAIQEVQDTVKFRQLVNSMDGYSGYLKSGYFAGLAYIYKTSDVVINDIYEIYTTSQYWTPFPRSPMVMDLTFKGERFIVINNHFKCCGDGIMDIYNPKDEESRRFRASNLLREYIALRFNDDNVIVCGDFNDEITDETPNNVFQRLLDDNQYTFADMAIATGSEENWSYPSWPSHLDHILITDELKDNLIHADGAIETMKVDDYLDGGWWQYDANISDHRPVAIRLHPEGNAGAGDAIAEQLFFTNQPNPVMGYTTFTFKQVTAPAQIEIWGVDGVLRQQLMLKEGSQSCKVQCGGMPDGVYVALLRCGKELMATKKIMVTS